MGSEIFRFKSIDLEPTVVRGARSGTKNARNTAALSVNYGDDSVTHSGERGIRAQYLIESSLQRNDYKGIVDFTDGSFVASGYTGPYDPERGDYIRHDGDAKFYAVTGIEGQDVYLAENYTKTSESGPDLYTGQCSVHKTKLGNAMYEAYEGGETGVPFYYDRDKGEWEPTGMDAMGPYVAYSGVIGFSTGIEIKFNKGASPSFPDLCTIDSVYKTLVNNSTWEYSDVVLSPIPYPHETLQVYWGSSEDELQRKTEFEDYVINYSNSPDFVFPYPPYEERRSAYIKFLDTLTDELQVTGINDEVGGIVAVSKEVEVESGGSVARKPVQKIIYGTDSVTVGQKDAARHSDYLMDYDAGTLVFVDHVNREQPCDHVAAPRELIWNGISVIKGTDISEVRDFDDLVIPGVTGLSGVPDGNVVYYEDTDENNLVVGVDYTIEYTSGAVRMTNPLRKGESVLVSYYVEGEDVEVEKIDPSAPRLSKYPVLADSVSIIKRWSRTDQYGQVETGSSVLVEGDDFEISYFTGRVTLVDPTTYSEDVLSLEVTYTPLSQVHCILQSKPDEVGTYRMTVVDDALEVVEEGQYIFKVNNPVVSIPVRDYFKKSGDPARLSFNGSILMDSPMHVKLRSSNDYMDTEGATYSDQERNLSLDTGRNTLEIPPDDTVVATYSFESEVLPYAPVQIFYPVLPDGASTFLIDGFDRTDVIKTNTILRIENRDPVAVYYYRVQSSVYENEGTLVTVYGSFPEDMNAPIFHILDGPVSWQQMPDTSSLVGDPLLGAESLIFAGGVLEIMQGIKVDSLLMIDGRYVYSVRSVGTVDGQAVIEIQPPLQEDSPSTIVYSRTPVYGVGETTLIMRNLILEDALEPAFTLNYEAPEGFEGSGSVFVDTGSIYLTETVGGTTNPVPYIYRKSDYASVHDLALAIQSTKSTYNDNVTIGPRVPDYLPFTISPSGAASEQYYLADGTYSADLVQEFDDFQLRRLPYTLTIGPELFRWSLLRTYRGKSNFTVKDVDLTARFISGDLLAFSDSSSGSLQYLEVEGVSVEDRNDRQYSSVELSESFSENMLDPAVYFKRGVIWGDVPNDLLRRSEDGSSLTLRGNLSSNIVVGTLLKLENDLIRSVSSVESAGDSTILGITPALPSDYKVSGRPGYRIQQSPMPVPLGIDPSQPYMLVYYAAPEMHTGSATMEAGTSSITLVETVDGFRTKTTILKYSDYDDLNALANAIGQVESLEGGKPFTVSMPDSYRDLFDSDGFGRYRIAPFETISLPTIAYVATGVLRISYTAPSGYTGSTSMVVTSSGVTLKESVTDIMGTSQTKDTTVVYSDYGDLFSFGDEGIENVESVIDGYFPFSVDSSGASELVADGSWLHVHPSAAYNDYEVLPSYIHVTTDFESWRQIGPLNFRRLVLDEDYGIDAGLVTLESGVEDLDRFSMSYMGRDLRSEDEGESVYVSCRYFSNLPAGSRLDVFLDYLNVDQFYLQKLTERDFSEIVVVPQIEELLELIASGNGQGADTSPTDEQIPNWAAGVVSYFYLLQDEEIKKALFLKFYHWYKRRLRALSAELQLGMGFKFARSNAVGEIDGRLTLQDAYVENTDDYTLTTDTEISRTSDVYNSYSKFFPIGYDKQAPRYYPRFGTEYRLYNEVYCFNVQYTYLNGTVKTIGKIKSVRPYWSKDLDHVILRNTNDNLIAYYNVGISDDERTFSVSDDKYSWLKRVSVGDKVRMGGYGLEYEIESIDSGIDSGSGATYEIMVVDRTFSEKGVKTFNLKQHEDGKFYYTVRVGEEIEETFNQGLKATSNEEVFNAALFGDGRNISIIRSSAESFPMFDDEGMYGARIEGGEVEGHVKHKDRIRKSPLNDFLKLMFPWIPELNKNVRLEVGAYNEDTLAFVPTEQIVVNLSKLNFIEERKISSTQTALYKNEFDDDTAGFEKYFYLSFERIYDTSDIEGYREGYVLRAKDRDIWARLLVQVDEEGEPLITDVAEEYGFSGNLVYKNFYDPDNIYRWLLMEKQAWQFEELILRDLYDYNDKIARAYSAGRIRLDNVSPYKGYMARYQAGEPAGVSDWLAARLVKYERALYFLIGGYSGYGDQGPLFDVMRPDGVHDEDDATPQIARSYQNASTAYSKYESFYGALQEFKAINYQNNEDWKNDYVRWVTGLSVGVMHQKTSREMYKSQKKIEIGLVETQALRMDVSDPGRYEVDFASVTTSSDSILVYAVLSNPSDPSEIVAPYLRTFSLKDAEGNEYISLDSLAAFINSSDLDGFKPIIVESVYPHYPYGETTCELLVRSTVTLSLSDSNYVSMTNVADHRASDPRILFLNRMIEDKFPTDNEDDPENPYGVWPVYTDGGNSAKRAIEGLPVAGEWETLPSDFFEVINIRCPGASMFVEFVDMDEGDVKEYMGPQEIIAKIDAGEVITEEEFEQIGQMDPPSVTILKYLKLIRRGVSETPLQIDLREYDTINKLVSAINDARFDSDGNQTPGATLQLFEAELIGDPAIQGEFKSYEIHASYVPIKKDFVVEYPRGEQYKYGYIVGYELQRLSVRKDLDVQLRVETQRYSQDATTGFLMDGPEEARDTTLNKFPLGLRQDIVAFDLYCWDGEDDEGRREYEVVNNYMHFRSANVDDIAVPLAGSGDPSAPDRETLIDLVDRINSYPTVSDWFFANLRYTRDDARDPGYFEYGYLPGFRQDVPKADLRNFVLRKDDALRLRSTESTEYQIVPDGPYNPADPDTVFTSLQLNLSSDTRVLSIEKGSDYTFSSSSMVVDDVADTLTLSATYTYPYQYSKTFDFSDTSYDTISELVSAINLETFPGVGGAIFTAVLNNDDTSTDLLEVSGTLSGVPTQVYKETAPTSAFTLSVSSGGVGYAVSDATFSIPAARSQIVLSCTITYTGSYSPAAIDISSGNYTISSLASHISTLKPYVDPAFTAIFPSSVFNGNYSGEDASGLLDVSESISDTAYARLNATETYDLTGYTFDGLAAAINSDASLTGVTAEVIGDYGSAESRLLVPSPSFLPMGAMIELTADFRGLIGMRMLNMFNPSYASIYGGYMEIVADGNYQQDLPLDTKDLHGWIDTIKGDFGSGMVGVQVLPIKVNTVPYGVPEESSQALPYNEPSHVYFGIMGDIKFVQVSDHNLHVQLNNVKRRLGKPWQEETDYYTPERYDENNPNAIDSKNFLGWLRNTRYSQIRQSILDEELVSNKHLWLFLKMHREYGADQKACQLRKRIESNKDGQMVIRDVGL